MIGTQAGIKSEFLRGTFYYLYIANYYYITSDFLFANSCTYILTLRYQSLSLIIYVQTRIPPAAPPLRIFQHRTYEAARSGRLTLLDSLQYLRLTMIRDLSSPFSGHWVNVQPECHFLVHGLSCIFPTFRESVRNNMINICKILAYAIELCWTYMYLQYLLIFFFNYSSLAIE